MLELIQSSGADAVVATTPYYYQADTSVQIQHYQAIAQEAALPLVLYNIPSKTHNSLHLEAVKELQHIESIIAIKDSSTDFAYLTQLIELGKSQNNFRIFQGSERQALDALQAGADGVVSGLSNLIPQVFKAMRNFVIADNEAEAISLQEQIRELWKIHTYDHWLVCLKYAAAQLGLCGETCLGYRTPLSTEARREIDALVQQHAK